MKYILLVVLAVCAMLAARAQEIAGTKPFQIGVTDHVGTGSQGRDLHIYLPPGYTPERPWHVIYLLDGGRQEDFLHVAGLVQFMTDILDTLPGTIVVGITNVDRQHDFTFAPGSTATYQKHIPTAGGSAEFIHYLEQELIPYVAKKYNATGGSTLIGQSLGGLLAAEIVTKHIDLFDNYLIVSPSLWWNDEALLKGTPAAIAPKGAKHICIAGGSEGRVMAKGAHDLLHYIRANATGDVTASLFRLRQENHRTMLHNAAYKGLLLLLAKPTGK